MTAEQRTRLIIDLCKVISQHMQWLDGPDFVEAAEEVARAYFEFPPDDLEERVVAALRAQLKIGE